MALVIGCWLVQQILVGVAPSPWWVPDLTLVGTLQAVVRSPDRWLSYSMTGGLLVMAWAIRIPVALCSTYLLLGWAVCFLCHRWDATDPRVQVLLVGAASLLLSTEALWLEGLWSLPLAALAVGHAGLSSLGALCVRRLGLKA